MVTTKSVPLRGKDDANMDSDSTTELFLAALTGRDFPAAVAWFDDAARAALPETKLAVVWDVQVASLGSLRRWTILERAKTTGASGPLDIRVALVAFERGELQVTISIRPEAQRIAGLFFKPASRAAATSAAYVDRSTFRDDEVVFGSPPFVLRGTLSIPTTGGGPYPAIVLVHGSGPQDRDETVGANRPFKDLAEGLASRGIAALRYDKRTFAHGRALAESRAPIGIDDEVVLDAVSAVKLLAGRPEIDRRRVFVVGHSLGALLAPEIAARAGARDVADGHEGLRSHVTVAGAVLLAPPGRPPWESVLAQMRYLDVPRESLAEVERQVALLKVDELGDATLLGAPAKYWKDWAARDGVAVARSLGARLLILRGARDYQVTDEDLATWRDGLRDLPNVTTRTVPSVNHLFVEGTGKPSPAEYALPGHVAESVIEMVARFVTER